MVFTHTLCKWMSPHSCSLCHIRVSPFRGNYNDTFLSDSHERHACKANVSTLHATSQSHYLAALITSVAKWSNTTSPAVHYFSTMLPVTLSGIILKWAPAHQSPFMEKCHSIHNICIYGFLCIHFYYHPSFELVRFSEYSIADRDTVV